MTVHQVIEFDYVTIKLSYLNKSTSKKFKKTMQQITSLSPNPSNTRTKQGQLIIIHTNNNKKSHFTTFASKIGTSQLYLTIQLTQTKYQRKQGHK